MKASSGNSLTAFLLLVVGVSALGGAFAVLSYNYDVAIDAAHDSCVAKGGTFLQDVRLQRVCAKLEVIK